MERTATSIMAACWVVFVAYWITSALRAKPILETQSKSSAAVHRIPILLGGFFLAYPHFGLPFNWTIMPHSLLMLAAGAAVCVGGLFGTLWARWTLAGNWSSAVTFKQNHELIRTGPYRFVRHPIYTGLLIMCAGTAMEIGQVRGWLGTVLMAVGFWIKLSQEERLLLRHFPEAYPTYQKEVKALVPWVI